MSSAETIIQIFKRNKSVDTNSVPPEVDIHLTSHGSSWLWAAFALFALFAVVHGFIYSFVSVRKSGLKKALLTIPLFTNAVLAFAYYTYASNLGYTWIETEFHHVTTDRGIGNRQIFYLKFVAYFLAWPLVLTLFLINTNTLLSESNNDDLIKKFVSIISQIFTRILAIEVFVLGLLIGALIRTSYKWGYFTFAVVAQLFVIYLVCVDLHKSFTSANKSLFANLIIIFTIIPWVLYPIAWGLSEGGNVIQPDSEAVFYGILDLITFGLVPICLTWIAINNIDEDFFTKIWHFHLRDGGRSDGAIDHEKEVGSTTPRHSGDTAVAPAGVPSTVDEAEAINREEPRDEI